MPPYFICNQTFFIYLEIQPPSNNTRLKHNLHENKAIFPIDIYFGNSSIYVFPPFQQFYSNDSDNCIIIKIRGFALFFRLLIDLGRKTANWNKDANCH